MKRFHIEEQFPGIQTTLKSTGSSAAITPPGEFSISIVIPLESDVSPTTPSSIPGDRSLIFTDRESMPREVGFRWWIIIPSDRSALRASSLIAAASIVERTGWRCNATLEGYRSARSVDGIAIFTIREAPAQIY